MSEVVACQAITDSNSHTVCVRWSVALSHSLALQDIAKGYLIARLDLEVVSLQLITTIYLYYRPRNWPTQLSVNSVC